MTPMEFVDTMFEIKGFGRMPAKTAMVWAITQYGTCVGLWKKAPNGTWYVQKGTNVFSADVKTFKRYYRSMMYMQRDLKGMSKQQFLDHLKNGWERYVTIKTKSKDGYVQEPQKG